MIMYLSLALTAAYDDYTNADGVQNLQIQTVVTTAIYVLLCIFVVINLYLFVYKKQEYKNIHTVAFYALGFMIFTFHIFAAYYSYCEYKFHEEGYTPT